jgi:histidinol-phosphate aminotransferase
MVISQLARPNILKMKAYSSARDEFKGTANVFLDANENPFDNDGLNRYPDPLAFKVKHELAKIKGVPATQIFLGNGSDEVIDVLMRIFCEPRVDNIMILPPTYGMYQVSADTCDVEIRRVNLTADFQPKVDDILRGCNAQTKLLFLCSPNNPSGNSFDADKIEALFKGFGGIVVIDEAYIDFSAQPSWTQRLAEFPNLVVMQTFSKAWGLAAIRCGMAFASQEIIDLMNKVKPPYNVNELTQRAAYNALQNGAKTQTLIAEILSEREKLAEILRGLDWVEKVFPSDANFLLVRIPDANGMYDFLLTQGVVVRNRANVALCEGCLRITVGTVAENVALVAAMEKFMTVLA